MADDYDPRYHAQLMRDLPHNVRLRLIARAPNCIDARRAFTKRSLKRKLMASV